MHSPVHLLLSLACRRWFLQIKWSHGVKSGPWAARRWMARLTRVKLTQVMTNSKGRAIAAILFDRDEWRINIYEAHGFATEEEAQAFWRANFDPENGEFHAERRRHKRFDMTSLRVKVMLVQETSDEPRYEDCTLVNLSYGGLRVLAHRPLQEGDKCQFLIELQRSVKGSAVVEALIRWVRSVGSEAWDLGAQFLESSKGWLGPEENDLRSVAEWREQP